MVHKKEFLSKWLKNPLQYGSVRESSRELAQLMVDQVPKDANWVVEFGAGTGPITEELARRFDPSKVFSFELDGELAARSRARAPGITVYNENVVHAAQLLPANVVGQVDAVLSSLPLVSLTDETNREILKSAFQLLKPDGIFVQYTYLPVLPPIRVHREMSLWARSVGTVWRNLPPGNVWVFRR